MIVSANEEGICRAAQVIADGGVVAFPTDTVYGLCCDLCNEQAVNRIYEIKGRPARMPLIAMIAETSHWPQVAAEMPVTAQVLIDRWWPGPLTIIVPAKPEIPSVVLGGGATVGMRIPDHPIALELLRQVARPLATTSANLSGQPAVCAAEEVWAQLGDTVDLILEGACSQGVASTIVDCTTDPPAVLRAGPISIEELGQAEMG